MPNFSDWTLKDAQEAVAAAMAAKIDAADYEVNRKFVEDHDYWQDGDGFVGPTGGPALRSRVLAAVKPQFTPVDIANEVLTRFVNALLKTEASVDFAPVDGDELTEQQQVETTAMSAALALWWDRVKLWEQARVAVKRSRWGGRGSLRTSIPPGQLEVRETKSEDGTVTESRVLPTGLTFADALARITLTAEEPKTCAVVVDDETLERVAVFLFKQDERESAEIWRVNGDTVELRVLTDGASTDYPSFPVPALPIAEMTADLLITEPVRRQLKRASFGESIVTRLMETSAFRERYTGNSQKEGEWVTSATVEQLGLLDLAHLETREVDGTTWYKVPRPRTLGSSVLTELVGLPIFGQNGEITGYTTPTITALEPTDPEFGIKAAQHSRASVLKDCHQAHVIGAENLQRSGISIVQARADFADDAVATKAPAEGMLRDILTAVIAWAGAMSSEFGGFLERYRVVVNLKVNPGPLSPEERARNAEDVKAGLMSEEAAMVAAGVEDVAAERALIAENRLGSLELATKEAEAVKAWGDATGLSWFAAALLAGVPEDRVTAAVEMERRVSGVGPENGSDPLATRIPMLTQ